MRNRLCFLTLFLLTALGGSLWAQTPRADSLRRVLTDDTTNFDVLMKLAKALVDVDNAEAMALTTKARIMARAADDTVGIIHSSRVIGQIHNRLGNVEMAIQELEPLLSIAETRHYVDEVKMILNSLALAHAFKAEYDKALEYHFKSLVIREREQNKKDISVTLNNIGALYISSSNFEQALIYLDKCLQVKQEIGDKFDLDKLYHNLGLCLSETGNYDQAEVYFSKAIKECEPNCSNSFFLSVEYSIGEMYSYKKEFKKAEIYLSKSLARAVKEGHLQYQLLSWIALAKIALEQHDLISANRYLTRIDLLPGKEPFLLQLQLFYSLSSEYYFQKGAFRDAFLYQKKYLEAREKINNSKVNKRIADIQLRFVERENIQKIQNQEKLLASQNLAIQKQEIINFLGGGLAMLTILLIVILFKMNRRKTQINRILDQLVRERTSELERSRIELQHSYDEQKFVLDKVGSELMSSLATIQGLKNVAQMENFANGDKYFDGAEATLFRSIKSIRAGTTVDMTSLPVVNRS